MSIVSADKHGKVDNVWYDLLKHVDSPYPIVPITKIEDYQFNEELLKLDKWILCCGCEYGWNFPFEQTGSHIWGVNTFEHDFGFKGVEWQKFDDFVKSNPPLLLMKRELMEGEETDKIVPLNYPCWHEIPPMQTKEQFGARPLIFNFVWGLSNEHRKTIHGEVWQRAGEFGYVVCDNIQNILLFLEKETNSKKVLTANVPWYARNDMSVVTKINELSKISISVGGCGRHCFRHSESPMASIMYLWNDGIKYSYPWVHNVNCIMSEQGKELETIIEAMNNPNLYDIYVAGVKNCKKYSLNNYVKNYIEPLIKNV